MARCWSPDLDEDDGDDGEEHDQLQRPHHGPRPAVAAPRPAGVGGAEAGGGGGPGRPQQGVDTELLEARVVREVKVRVWVGGRRVPFAAHHLTVAGRQLWVGHLCLCHPEPWRVEAGAPPRYFPTVTMSSLAR